MANAIALVDVPGRQIDNCTPVKDTGKSLAPHHIATVAIGTDRHHGTAATQLTLRGVFQELSIDSMEERNRAQLVPDSPVPSVNADSADSRESEDVNRTSTDVLIRQKDENPLSADSAATSGTSAAVKWIMFVALGHTLSASTLTVANDWALKAYPFPSTLTMLQVFFTVLVSVTVSVTGLSKVEPLDPAKMWQYLPAASMFFITMSAGQQVISVAGVETFIAMRCSVPAVTFFAEGYILNGPKPSLLTTAPLFVMLAGAVIFIQGNFAVLTTDLVLWGTFYLLIMPVDSLLIKKSLSNMQLTPWGMVLCVKPTVAPLFEPAQDFLPLIESSPVV